MVMPGLVGGYGNKSEIMYNFSYNILGPRIAGSGTSAEPKLEKRGIDFCSCENKIKELKKYGSYLAGLIEGDGTFAIHDKDSKSKKHNPMIIIVFKLRDLPLAEYLCMISKCGTVYKKENRGYVL
jgi:hypothetical protein